MWVHCTREDFAGDIEATDAGTYGHKMRGSCKCGTVHGSSIDLGSSGGGVSRTIVATYNYRDENACLLFQVVRFAGKDFRQRIPDGAGGWIWRLGDTRRVIYRLPELLMAEPSRTVYVCEGEKDVETLVARGEVATCNPMGAGKWSKVAGLARSVLEGRTVVIIADADDPGRKHAKDVLLSLTGVAGSVRVIEPLPPYKDVTDHLEAGWRLEDLGVEVEGAQASEGEPPVDPGPWKILTVKDLSEELPPIPWVCEKLGLAPGVVSLAAGYGYSRKTMAWQSAGLSVAAGKPVWGLHSAKKGKFVHLDYEQGRRLTQERYQRLARGMGFDLRDLEEDALKVVAMPDLYLDDKTAFEALLRLLDGATFALIDSLRAAFPKADENSSEIRQHLDVLSRVSERTGCAPLTIHHARKPNKDNADGATFAIRGSSALFDACQSVYVFEGAKDTPTRVKHQKDRIRGAAVDDFGLDSVDVPGPDGEPRWGLRIVHMEASQIDAVKEAAEAVRDDALVKKASVAIAETLKRSAGVFRGGKTAFRSACRVGTTPFETALGLMVSTGAVKSAGSYHHPEWHLTGNPNHPHSSSL